MIPAMQTEIINLSDLVSHNKLDLEEIKDQLANSPLFNKNICHLYEVDEELEDLNLDLDGKDDTILVNLQG